MSTDLTRTSATFGSPALAPSRTAGRFVAGTVLANRYRIVNLLGIGGMGEVYKADDLTLESPVALKFLPETLALSPGALSRFHAEARIARQVSHPNVCRVHDVGAVDGLQFITMEFIDGEDLASLLRRIGRLPADKAVEIARQLCAGIAAAHDVGVLHRDLKPHNVMIDGRGRARITDFGVAAIAREIREEHIIAGTPAYMAPEQLRGEPASVRSDVYALGLVLYELFTGKRAVEAGSLVDAATYHSSGSTVTTPSDLVRDLDPNVERVIMRCLERDPVARPASAIQVAAGLPGGDPLQAALAAGETPSPEMVAAAGSHDIMRPAVALTLAAATIAAIFLLALAATRITALRSVVADVPPEELPFQAREMLTALGYPDRLRDRASGLERSSAGTLRFWYRESPDPLYGLIGLDPTGGPIMPSISIDNPPASVRGMRHLRLDMNGRLLEFGAIPLEIDGSTEPARPMDWKLLFTSAGLDRSAFEPTTPSWIPPVESDERAAWSGVVPGQPDQPLRLEAAAHRGRLVAFRRSSASPSEPPQRVSTPFLTVLLESLILVSLVLAWFNARSGRVDRRGAIRLGVPFFLLALAKWVVGGHYALTWESLVQFRHAASQALFLAVTTVIIYLAVEPHVRRRWPTVLVAWSRVLAGRWRDPLVGRHVLVGMAMSSVAGLLFLAGSFWGMRNIVADSYTVLTNVLSARTTLAELISIPLAGIAPALFTTIYMLVLRTVTPGDLAAVTLAAVVAGASYFAQGGMITVPIGAALAVLSATCLIRFGLVALMAYFLTSSMLAVLTAAFVLNSGAAAVTLLAIAGLALGAAYVAMGSPKLPRTTGTAATL